MKYRVYTFSVLSIPNGLTHEIVFDLLSDSLLTLGFDSFEQSAEAQLLKAYRPATTLDDSQIDTLLAGFPLKGLSFAYQSEDIPTINWNEEWEKNSFRPIVVDQLIHVRAPFHPTRAEIEHEVLISPRMAFGTGNHQTTRLMLKILLNSDLKGKRVLDMGTGTGILAIAACKLGANMVDAIDIDEWCYDNSIENATLNNEQDKIEVRLGDASLLNEISNPYDFILANINRNILLQDLPKYTQKLQSAGFIAISGFLLADRKQLIDLAESLGLKLIDSLHEDDWAAMLFNKTT